MAAMYGAKFADAWKGVDAASIKSVWAEELAGYAASEIRRGVDGLRTRDWPPTLPEFLKLCRPPIDPEAAFVEAVREMRKRIDSGSDDWSRPEVFWAAQAVGWFDLTNNPYQRIQNRWKAALEHAKRDPVPVKLIELPRRGDVVASREHVKQVMADLDARLKAKPELDKARAAGKPSPVVDPAYAAALADVERREAERRLALGKPGQ